MDSSSPTSASAPKLEFSTQPVLKEGAGARIAHYGPCPKTGEAVRDRIYVSSRTYKSKTECLQTRRSPYTDVDKFPIALYFLSPYMSSPIVVLLDAWPQPSSAPEALVFA